MLVNKMGETPSHPPPARKRKLYQISHDVYCADFENSHVLANLAYRFETIAAGGTGSANDVQAGGDRKVIFVDDLLRRRVVAVSALDDGRLAVVFDGGGQLIIHDSPDRRSAWFYRYDGADHNKPLFWSDEDELAACER